MGSCLGVRLLGTVLVPVDLDLRGIRDLGAFADAMGPNIFKAFHGGFRCTRHTHLIGVVLGTGLGMRASPVDLRFRRRLLLSSLPLTVLIQTVDGEDRLTNRRKGKYIGRFDSRSILHAAHLSVCSDLRLIS